MTVGLEPGGTRSHWSLYRTGMIVIILFVWVVQPLLARRTSDFVPPPYLSRLFISLFTLSPFAFLLALLSYLPLRKRDLLPAMPSCARLAGSTLLCLLLGALLAATDGLNDELWQPYTAGAFSLSFIPPLRLLAVPNTLSLPRRKAFAFALFAALVVPLQMLVALCQDWGMQHGLPTTW
jgi:hypothetical protein